ncbi:UNVERIFIED_ORG: hypothetical protein B5F06_11780 [Lacrimispora saccharolytica]|nr:hypothetical protein DW757_11430 [Clostridium sp. AM29-11AC]
MVLMISYYTFSCLKKVLVFFVLIKMTEGCRFHIYMGEGSACSACACLSRLSPELLHFREVLCRINQTESLQVLEKTGQKIRRRAERSGKCSLKSLFFRGGLCGKFFLTNKRP